MPTLRIATFNLENFDDLGQPAPSQQPTLAQRIAVMRPQVQRVRADVLCLQEIHSQGPAGQRTLDALDALLAGTANQNYNRATTTTVAGDLYDERNLVILSRYPIMDAAIIRDSDGTRPSYQFATADPPDTTANPVQWERPLLHVQLDIGNNATLHVVNLHLKSRIATNVRGRVNGFEWESASAWAEGSFVSAMKRVGQALQTRMLVDEIFDSEGEHSLIAVCGDFNSDQYGVPLEAIKGLVENTENPSHAPRVLVPCENNIPDSSRYSLLHLGRREMFDHVLASRGLLQFFSLAEVHNQTLPDESGAFRTDVKFPESDHAPVVAEFTIS